MIIDDFIESFDELRNAAINNDFAGEVNPVDGVLYPLISSKIPVKVENEIISELSELIGRTIDNPFMFMRRSPEGVDCPHQVHSDASMGGYSLMLYINDHAGGTSLVRHKESGISYNPELQEFVDIVVKDQNNPEAWEITDMINMKPNRAFVFRSDMLHRAEPIGGFGSGSNSRVILTCFFS